MLLNELKQIGIKRCIDLIGRDYCKRHTTFSSLSLSDGRLRVFVGVADTEPAYPIDEESFNYKAVVYIDKINNSITNGEYTSHPSKINNPKHTSLLLLQYEEFAPPGSGFPSITKFFQQAPYPGKDRIVAYLKLGDVHMCCPGYDRDVITGEIIRPAICHMDDGRYAWTSDLIYYVEKYNMRLPAEFERYVMEE